MFNRSKFALWVENYLFYPSFAQRLLSYILLPFSAIYCLVVWKKRRDGKAKKMRFKPDDQLFNVTRFGANRYKYKTMQDSNISNAFRELSARLEFPASPHRLRHTLGTKLMRQPEKNLHLVKAIFGHKDIRTTLEYVVPDLEDMRDLLNTMPKLTK